MLYGQSECHITVCTLNRRLVAAFNHFIVIDNHCSQTNRIAIQQQKVYNNLCIFKRSNCVLITLSCLCILEAGRSTTALYEGSTRTINETYPFVPARLDFP